MLYNIRQLFLRKSYVKIFGSISIDRIELHKPLNCMQTQGISKSHSHLLRNGHLHTGLIFGNAPDSLCTEKNKSIIDKTKIELTIFNIDLLFIIHYNI